MKGVLSWLVSRACRAGIQEVFVLLSCSSRPSTKYFFPTVHYFNSCFPSAQLLGRKSCRAACLWMSGLPLRECPWKKEETNGKLDISEEPQIIIMWLWVRISDGSGGRGGMFARNSRVEEGGRYGGLGAVSTEICVNRFGLADSLYQGGLDTKRSHARLLFGSHEISPIIFTDKTQAIQW